MSGHLYLLYHFFHPDDVISARLYAELGSMAAAEGWQVTALPANRSCHARQQQLPRRESWDGVDVRRVWRPNFSQSRALGRLLNTLFMLAGWTWFALWHRRQRNEVVIIGTDPIFGILAAWPWRLLRPRSRIVHWCHDVHPEASLADEQADPKSWFVRGLRGVLRTAYRRCDMIVDLGPCMRKLLAQATAHELVEAPDCTIAHSSADLAQSRGVTPATTITPWSLVEPDAPADLDPAVRHDLFGETRLGLLYSGNLGRAHEFQHFIRLAREFRRLDNPDVASFCFAGRGVGMESLQTYLTPQDTNIRMAGFASESVLEKRLSACDIHLVSLKESWTGTVVPSKFFGALSIGRPVLFVGSPDSAIAKWIEEYDIGWLLNEHNVFDLAQELQRLFADPHAVRQLNRRCWQVYQQQFSRERQMARWRSLLQGTNQLPTTNGASPSRHAEKSLCES